MDPKETYGYRKILRSYLKTLTGDFGSCSALLLERFILYSFSCVTFRFKSRIFGANGVELDEIKNKSRVCYNQIISPDNRKIPARNC